MVRVKGVFHHAMSNAASRTPDFTYNSHSQGSINLLFWKAGLYREFLTRRLPFSGGYTASGVACLVSN